MTAVSKQTSAIKNITDFRRQKEETASINDAFKYTPLGLGETFFNAAIEIGNGALKGLTQLKAYAARLNGN